MRKIKYLFASALVAILVAGCKNDLNVLAPYKDIPVVYGLMDQSDTAHYIRINKVYEGPGNAYTMATVYDSIYYPTNEISVQLTDTSYGTWIKNIPLTPDSSIPVPPGTFSYPKQILYKTKYKLNPNDTYGLIITNEKTGKQITGSTILLQDVSFANNFATYPNMPMSFYSTAPSMVQWSSIQNSVIYQMTIRFFYYDSLPSNPRGSEQYLDWVFPTVSASSAGYPLEYSYSGQGFLQFLKSSIPVVTGAYRRSDSIGIIFTSGSNDLNTYIQLSQPSIGIDQDPPSFSDVKNAIGLFTARHTQILNKKIDPILRDSIMLNSVTAALDFH